MKNNKRKAVILMAATMVLAPISIGKAQSDDKYQDDKSKMTFQEKLNMFENLASGKKVYGKYEDEFSTMSFQEKLNMFNK